MTHRDPCHISEGPQTPDDAIPGLDDLPEAYPEIDVTDTWRQMELDDEKERQEKIIADGIVNDLKDIARSAA